MKITVLNGSPKGDISVTMQYVKYLQGKFEQHEFDYVNISQIIGKIEKDEKVFKEILDRVGSSDGVLWAFPVYFCFVPSQYKKFIELLFSRGGERAFSGKYAAVLTTSIHFFDHTAHNYMNAICDDLNMNFSGSFSAGMNDLLKNEERRRLIQFGDEFFESIDGRVSVPVSYSPLRFSDFKYIPGRQQGGIDIGGRKVLILTDGKKDDINLNGMIERFAGSFSGNVETVNLHDLDIKGGCLGCIKCGYENKCAYGDSDEFTAFFDARVKTADVLIFSGKITDRFLSAKWKQFLDRSFYNNHVPVFIDKQIGFLVSGPLGQVPDLKQLLEAYPDWQGGNPAGIITDECNDSARLDSLLTDFARRLVRFADSSYKKPSTFLGVGGRKIFRDDIWGDMRFIFQADHKYYKKHGLYDFPQKKWKMRARVWFMILLLKVPAVRKDVYSKMKHHMISPFKKLQPPPA